MSIMIISFGSSIQLNSQVFLHNHINTYTWGCP